MKKKHNIGSPPGTLNYTGIHGGERICITLIRYNENEFFEQDFYDLSECMVHVKEGMVNWINVDGIHNLNLIEKIGKLFNIHPLSLEDVVDVEQRPKFEEHDNYLLSILKMTIVKEVILQEHLSLLLLNNTVISFQEPNGGDAFDMIRLRLKQAKGRVRQRGADYLYYALMDSVVDWYFQVVDHIGERVDQIETQLLKDGSESRSSILQLYRLRREVINLGKQVAPLRDLVNGLSRCDSPLLKENVKIFHRDLYDHVNRIIDSVSSYRDLLNGLMDLYLSFNSNKMNEVMKVLTIISTVFIPVTFIVGVYGMNFDYMPELQSPYGYAGVWVLILIIMGGLVYYFRRKKWL